MDEIFRKWILGLMAIVVVAIIAAAAYFLVASGISAVVGLPMLAIGAVVVLLGLLAAMSVLYASYDLHDKTQALALPEGSIRAVIALMLIVLFAVLTIYLYGSISEGNLLAIDQPLTLSEKDKLVQTQPAGSVVFVQADNQTFRVWLRSGPSQEGVDFAKQLLILVGTLVTSISSFYFGSKATEAAKVQPPPPAASSLKNLVPKSYQRGSGGMNMTVEGENLDKLKAIKLMHEGSEVNATDLHAERDRASFTIEIPTAMPPGAWDLVGTDMQGRILRLPGSLTVT